MPGAATQTEHDLDGSVAEYDVPVDGDRPVDTGAWHFHLRVGDPIGHPEAARARRVARAALVRATSGPCVPEGVGPRLWNGLGDQRVTVFFRNPYDGEGRRLREPDDARAAFGTDLRRRGSGQDG
jgi:hypothetical protein